MMTHADWTSINAQRAMIYQWLGGVFALEQSEAQLHCYVDGQMGNLYELLHQLGLQNECERLKQAIILLKTDEFSVMELSADFAQHFLLDEKVSALPYASYYLEEGRLYGDVESKMQSFLADNHLAVSKSFKEPADHLAVYLYLMFHWIVSDDDFSNRDQIARDQVLFLQNGLLSWLPSFVAESQKQRLTYDFYPALTALLLAFIQLDVEYLT